MAKLYLIRHGRANAGLESDFDPGLDNTGWEQAKRTAERLSDIGPLDIVSSPLSRARETSKPLADIWGMTPRIEKRMGEIPSPTKNPAERALWLGHIMNKHWPDLDEDCRLFKQRVIDALFEIRSDTVIFTHFIAINIAVGTAIQDDRVVVFLPDNGSVTVMENTIELKLVERGSEMYTRVG